MILRKYGLIVALGGAVLCAPAAALADGHLDQAREHMRDAVMQGKLLHDAAMLAMQANLALDDAQATQKQTPSPELDEALVHIKAAIDEGRANHLDPAVKHSEEALAHLKAVVAK